MSYLVLARKWRPSGFDDLVGQEPITRILKNAISQGKIAHAYIFSGPRGVGKTSSARIFAKALNCKEGPTPAPCGVCGSCTAITDGSSVDVIEIDGASNNSVDDIRDLRERVKYAPSGGKYKVYIIDEVHMLSGSAFNALLKTLEEPPSHVIFVLATTEMKKIPATVLSRCQHMPFRRISSSEIRARLKHIAGTEGIDIAPPALGLVARAADGSMRDSLTILDQLSSFTSEITEESVKSLLGIADFGLLAKVSTALIAGNRLEILQSINLLTEQGIDIRAFTKELIQFFRDLLVARVVRSPEDALDMSADELAAVREIIAGTSEDQLTLMLSEIMKAETDVRGSSSPRLALEMALMKASFLSAMKPIKDVIEHLNRQQKEYGGPGPDTRAGISKEPAKAPAKDELESTVGSHSTPAAGPQPEMIPEPQAVPVPDAGSGPEAAFEKEARSDASPEEASAGGTDILAFWERTLMRIESPLAAKIQQAKAEVRGGELFLVLNGGHAVFEDSINKNLRDIENILEEEAGSRIKIRVTVDSAKKGVRKKDLKEKVKEEPLIKEALELFDGRIVDVTQMEKSENIKNGGDHV